MATDQHNAPAWYSTAELAARFGRTVEAIEAHARRNKQWPRLQRGTMMMIGAPLQVIEASLPPRNAKTV